MAGGKIIPLIAAQHIEIREEIKRAAAIVESDLAANVIHLEEEIVWLRNQFKRDLEQLDERVRRLEQGGGAPTTSA
jgi:hypothetical protein